MIDRTVLCVGAAGVAQDVVRPLQDAGWEVRHAADLRAAERALKEHGFLVGVLIGSELDDEGCERAESFLRRHPALEWVGIFDAASLRLPGCRDLIVDLLFDHHTLPVDVQRLVQTLGHAQGHAQLRRHGSTPRPAGDDSAGIVGQSPAIAQMRSLLRRIAKVGAPVLIRGESGTGKELAAQAIHKASPRAGGPFIAVNCGAIAPSLIHSELFGHVKGSFTGADRDKRGLIEAAAGGTLFLDEIGDLSPELQVNLLRYLQEGTISRVGSSQPQRVDARVIAATHVELEAAVAARRFREDLFYRLNVLPVRVPPLRERGADIELLARHYFEQFAHDKSPRVADFSQRALVAMQRHEWPGNVRELINRVRRAMVLAEGRLITPADLGLVPTRAADPSEPLGAARIKAERSAIFSSLQDAGCNVTQAARRLGVSRMTLYRLMAKHGIDA